MLIAIITPGKLIKEQEKDEQERRNFSQPSPPSEHNIMQVRRAFWTSLLLVIVSAISGYGFGYSINLCYGSVQRIVVNTFQITGVLFLLWATLFVRGWSIQTYGGVTLTERVNQWIFRSLYCIGTAIIISSFALSIC